MKPISFASQLFPRKNENSLNNNLKTLNLPNMSDFNPYLSQELNTKNNGFREHNHISKIKNNVVPPLGSLAGSKVGAFGGEGDKIIESNTNLLLKETIQKDKEMDEMKNKTNDVRNIESQIVEQLERYMKRSENNYTSQKLDLVNLINDTITEKNQNLTLDIGNLVEKKVSLLNERVISGFEKNHSQFQNLNQFYQTNQKIIREGLDLMLKEIG